MALHAATQTCPNNVLSVSTTPVRLVSISMNARLILEGALLGLSVAAPVGPIGLLCIRRTLTEGRAQGLAVGLGTATADAAYAFVGSMGLTFLSVLLRAWAPALQLAGVLFLVVFGIQTLRARPASEAVAVTSPPAHRGLLAGYLSALALTLMNPMTIASFAALFAGLGGAVGQRSTSAPAFAAGVFFGSSAWWFLLTCAVSLARERLSPRVLAAITRGAGIMLLGFAAAGAWSLVHSLVIESC